MSKEETEKNQKKKETVNHLYQPLKRDPNQFLQFCFIRTPEKNEKKIHEPIKSRIEKIEIEKELDFEYVKEK